MGPSAYISNESDHSGRRNDDEEPHDAEGGETRRRRDDTTQRRCRGGNEEEEGECGYDMYLSTAPREGLSPPLEIYTYLAQLSPLAAKLAQNE